MPATVKFFARRMVRLMLSLAAVLTASFIMIHLIPGDPVRAALGPTAPAELVAARRAEAGLDNPLWTQYWHYLTGLAHGDFGVSFTSRQPVGEVIASRLPNTLALALVTVLVALMVSVPLGMWLAARTENGRRPGLELSYTTASATVAAIPEYVLAVALIVVFAITLRWLPPAGKSGPESYILPVLALSTGPIAILSRLVRVETLRVLGEDYIRVARSKQLPPGRIFLRHVLPNSLTAALTIGGLLLSSLVAGSVFVETVFAWPGLGSRVVESILLKDYPVVQAVILVYGAAVLLVNLCVDVLLGILDPRSTITAG